MLEYVKLVLKKVSFDLRLFEKELKKALSYLSVEDVPAFCAWCYETFILAAYRNIMARYLPSVA